MRGGYQQGRSQSHLDPHKKIAFHCRQQQLLISILNQPPHFLIIHVFIIRCPVSKRSRLAAPSSFRGIIIIRCDIGVIIILVTVPGRRFSFPLALTFRLRCHGIWCAWSDGAIDLASSFCRPQALAQPWWDKVTVHCWLPKPAIDDRSARGSLRGRRSFKVMSHASVVLKLFGAVKGDTSAYECATTWS